jgi:hypothetical protein
VKFAIYIIYSRVNGKEVEEGFPSSQKLDDDVSAGAKNI